MSGPGPKTKPDSRSSTLQKQNSWSPDTSRNSIWLRRKYVHHHRRCRSKSLTDEDFDELKACIELGFGFDSNQSSEANKRLTEAFPALGFYVAVNKSYNNFNGSLSRTTSSSNSENDLVSLDSPHNSPLHNMFSPGEDKKKSKTWLRQWAQAVACVVKQSN